MGRRQQVAQAAAIRAQAKHLHAQIGRALPTERLSVGPPKMEWAKTNERTNQPSGNASGQASLQTSAWGAHTWKDDIDEDDNLLMRQPPAHAMSRSCGDCSARRRRHVGVPPAATLPRDRTPSVRAPIPLPLPVRPRRCRPVRSSCPSCAAQDFTALRSRLSCRRRPSKAKCVQVDGRT